MADDKGVHAKQDDIDPEDFDDDFDEDFDNEVDEDLVAFEQQLEADAKFDETHEGDDTEVGGAFEDDEDF